MCVETINLKSHRPHVNVSCAEDVQQASCGLSVYEVVGKISRASLLCQQMFADSTLCNVAPVAGIIK